MKKIKTLAVTMLFALMFGGASAQTIDVSEIGIGTTNNSSIFKIRIQNLSQWALVDLSLSWGNPPNIVGQKDSVLPIGAVNDTTIYIEITGLIISTVYTYQADLIATVFAFSDIKTFTTGGANPVCSVQITGNDSLCSGSSTTLNVVGSGGINAYTWSNQTIATSITVAPTFTTVYTVTGTSGTCTATNSFIVTVVSKPIITNEIYSKGTLVLTGSFGLIDILVDGKNYKPETTDTALYALFNVGLNNNDVVVIYTVPTIECFSYWKYSVSGIEELQNSNMKVYPNPFKDVLKVDIPQGKYQIFILDISGKEIQTFNEEKSFSFNRDTLPAGMYFLKINSEKVDRTFKIQVID